MKSDKPAAPALVDPRLAYIPPVVLIWLGIFVLIFYTGQHRLIPFFGGTFIEFGIFYWITLFLHRKCLISFQKMIEAQKEMIEAQQELIEIHRSILDGRNPEDTTPDANQKG